MDLGPPTDWAIKGQGNANIVFSYVGNDPRFINKVLRVPKHQQHRPPPTTQLGQLERAVWKDLYTHISSHNSSGSTDIEYLYVEQYLAQLLGRQYLPDKNPIKVHASFASALLSATAPIATTTATPAITNNSATQTTTLPAALMPDVTVFNKLSSISTHSKAICVEIKPKCGFISNCTTVNPKHISLKHSTSRYQLHQQLKLLQQGATKGGGGGGVISQYDPCDLFSGEEGRMKSALGALMDSPQNNFVLFVDGERVIFSDVDNINESISSSSSTFDRYIEESCIIGKKKSVDEENAGTTSREVFIDVLYQILHKEGILQSLLQVQKQCTYDIEGIYPLYCSLLDTQQQLPPAPTTNSNDNTRRDTTSSTHNDDVDETNSHKRAIQQLLALPLEDKYNVLKSYLISTTAKDCSIMITLQRLTDSAVGEYTQRESSVGYGVLQYPYMPKLRDTSIDTEEERGALLPPTKLLPETQQQKEAQGAWYKYRICYVDLDMKMLEKTPKHYVLDTQIINAAKAAAQG